MRDFLTTDDVQGFFDTDKAKAVEAVIDYMPMVLKVLERSRWSLKLESWSQ